MTLEGLPMPLRWLVPPVRWEAAGSRLVVEAAGRTDWFIDPAGEAEGVRNAPALLGDTTGDFIFSARVRADFAATFDAGVLLLYVDERVWAKLCFEYSPQQQPMVVSVVTRQRSDDANAFVVPGREAWLRIARLGPAFAFHASTDGRTWHLVRYFGLGDGVAAAVGFEAQAPTGNGCTVTFDEIRFAASRLRDLRDGT